jgi:hypothetical protein
MCKWVRAFLFVGVFVGCVPAMAGAQSHWGVSFSATPSWKLAGQLEDLLEDEDASVDMSGSEFTVGLVRGSTRGGDWGVSFVHKPFKDGSGSIEVSQDCFQSTCFTSTETNVFQDVKLSGVEFHWFARFVNIKDRVQIGLNIAGGVASVKGNVIKTNEFPEVTNFDPRTGAVTAAIRGEVEVVPAKDELFSIFPLGKVEAAGTVILHPALKARVSGGLNFPGYAARIGLVYLIGAQ